MRTSTVRQALTHTHTLHRKQGLLGQSTYTLPLNPARWPLSPQTCGRGQGQAGRSGTGRQVRGRQVRDRQVCRQAGRQAGQGQAGRQAGRQDRGRQAGRQVRGRQAGQGGRQAGQGRAGQGQAGR